MILVIAEKPALGEAIADAIPGPATKKDGVITKGEYVITWAFGHLLTIKEPEDYDEKYKSWNIADLPIYFEPWGNKPGKSAPGKPSKSDRLKQIGDLLKQADSVIHAGDIDEEGQLLIDEILRWFKYKGPVKRIDTSNTTTPALKKALNHLKDNTPCQPDGWSAYGRELSDAIFGFNLTRYYSALNGALMPIGRVQTPTLGLVVRRDELIENHQKLLYYELFAKLKVGGELIVSQFKPNKDDPALTDGKVLQKSFLEGKEAFIKDKRFEGAVVSKKSVFQAPPLPFNYTKLTTYCSGKWGYNPDTVLKVTQALRDKYRAITYNRSDCQYLSEDHFKEAPQTIAVTCANLGLNTASFNNSIKSKCFNDANITAHFAIIPSGEKVDINKFTEQEKNIYTAISQFYLAQFMPAAEREKTELNLDLGNGESLHATGSIPVSAGYLSLLSGSDLEEESTEEGECAALCKLQPGTYSATVLNTNIQGKETKPPARYTEASLQEDMTRIAKYVDDPHIKQLLMAKDKGKKGENGSIGTTATRATIIKGLIKRGLLETVKKGKKEQVISTPKGRALYRMLPDNLKKADTTALWWVMQEDIKLGKQTPEGMAKSVLSEVSAVIKSGAGRLENAASFAGGGTGVVIGPCPICDGQIVERQNSYCCSTKGCKAVYFKENKLLISLGKKMSIQVVRALIKDGRCKLDNCKSKSGNKYSCFLIADYSGESKYVNFRIEMPGTSEASIQNPLGNCPLCGKPVIKDSYGHYSCIGRKEGCKFRIWSEVSGKKLTDANVKALLTKGHTNTLNDFKSKSGKTFDAALRLEADGSLKFVFPTRQRK